MKRYENRWEENTARGTSVPLKHTTIDSEEIERQVAERNNNRIVMGGKYQLRKVRIETNWISLVLKYYGPSWKLANINTFYKTRLSHFSLEISTYRTFLLQRILLYRLCLDSEDVKNFCRFFEERQITCDTVVADSYFKKKEYVRIFQSLKPSRIIMDKRRYKALIGLQGPVGLINGTVYQDCVGFPSRPANAPPRRPHQCSPRSIDSTFLIFSTPI